MASHRVCKISLHGSQEKMPCASAVGLGIETKEAVHGCCSDLYATVACRWCEEAKCAESSSDCGQVEPPPPSWWQRVADIQTDGSDVDPFLFKVDAVTCSAHTPRGNRKKRSDKSEVCHMLWRMERKVSIEDGFAADVEFMETASAYSVLGNWAPCTAVGQLLVFFGRMPESAWISNYQKPLPCCFH